jgi:hypothetical protein
VSSGKRGPNNALEPTAYSFGFAYAFGGGSPRAFGSIFSFLLKGGSRDANHHDQ